MLDAWIVDRHPSKTVQKEAIGFLHDVRLMNGGDLLASVLFRELEGEHSDSRAGFLCHDLQRFDDAGNDFMLESGIQAFRVFPYDDEIDVAESRWNAGQTYHRLKVRATVDALQHS